MSDEGKVPAPESGGQHPAPAPSSEEPEWSKRLSAQMQQVTEMLNPDPDKEEERRQQNIATHRRMLDERAGIHNANDDDSGDDGFEIVSVEELPELIEDVADAVTEPVKAAAKAVEKVPEKVHFLFRAWGGRKG